jgi:hypothetical protein
VPSEAGGSMKAEGGTPNGVINSIKRCYMAYSALR